jgi:predicted kinase
MIKLGTILYEVAKNKRAILFAGPAGSGKSTIIKNYIPSEFQEYVLNPDKYFEPELEKIGGGSMNQGAFTSDQLSQASKAMQKAQIKTKEDYKEAVLRGRPVIMDVTGGSKNTTTKKKNELENAGYDVMMVMVYASPMTTLRRNTLRDRSLKPSIVLRSWKDVTNNIDHYKQTFGDSKFAIVNNNDPDGGPDTFSADKVEQFFKINPNYQELSPEQKTVLEREFQGMIDKVNQNDFTAFDELDSKIKTFLNIKK